MTLILKASFLTMITIENTMQMIAKTAVWITLKLFWDEQIVTAIIP